VLLAERRVDAGDIRRDNLALDLGGKRPVCFSSRQSVWTRSISSAAAPAPWFFGPYGFVLANVRPLRTPVPEKGRLGLARASDDLRGRVARALRSTEPHQTRPARSYHS
jgi:hypothetical protein